MADRLSLKLSAIHAYNLYQYYDNLINNDDNLSRRIELEYTPSMDTKTQRNSLSVFQWRCGKMWSIFSSSLRLTLTKTRAYGK